MSIPKKSSLICATTTVVPGIAVDTISPTVLPSTLLVIFEPKCAKLASSSIVSSTAAGVSSCGCSTVVDADDLLIDMTNTAREISEELGKLEGYTEDEKAALYKTIGLGALKYHILKVDPKKRIMFDPKESIDFNGNTGPFIQYTYARIQSILRKATFDYSKEITAINLDLKERELIKQIQLFPEIIQNAAQNHSPAIIANYAYDLVKIYNSFYQTVPILGCENQDEKIIRIQLSNKVAEIIKSAFKLLGINVPERM